MELWSGGMLDKRGLKALLFHAQRSTLNAQRSTLNAQRSTLNAQRSTLNVHGVWGREVNQDDRSAECGAA